MRMLKMKYILFAAFLLSAAGISAQKAERDYIRKGNRLFNDSVFVDAEVNYRKALEVNPKSTVSMYNLGNTLSQQQKFQDAMEQYASASILVDTSIASIISIPSISLFCHLLVLCGRASTTIINANAMTRSINGACSK